jgi:hypothetical protein
MSLYNLVSWFMYCEYSFTLCSNPHCQRCFEKSFASYKDIDQYWSKRNNVQPRQVLKKTRRPSNKIYYVICPTCKYTCGVFPEWYHDNWRCSYDCRFKNYTKTNTNKYLNLNDDYYTNTNKYLKKPRTNLSIDVLTQNNLCNKIPSKNSAMDVYNSDV